MEKNVLVDNQKGRNMVDRKYCVNPGILTVSHDANFYTWAQLDQKKRKSLIIASYNSVAYILSLLEQ